MKENKFFYAIKNPKVFLWFILGRHIAKHIKNDELFIRFKWWFSMNYRLNLSDPKTFNEKLNWLKLYNRKPEFTMMVDKYLVKDYVASKIGQQYIIPTLGVWNSPEEIDFNKLPNSFVLKCNHNSGNGMIICKDKSKLNIENTIVELKKGLGDDYYSNNREWPYKNVHRKIIAEEYMEDNMFHYLRDYKFFCFDGEVKALYVATDRNKGENAVKFDFFDSDFVHLPFVNAHPNNPERPLKPKCFDEMKRIASILSKGLICSRVDLYEINGKVYFGEITFTHMGGFKPFYPQEWDYKFGEWIKLPVE
ncbi:ATP-grasp fold amidoligase family protein [Intestinibacter sp.]|uniref:ATP-grasp fold amidoligase family protein n=1 Tax=Intestinibacter sp. TaxID=1965304 RepID=UPI002A760A42|nr:ATP-grasp fold amidoligase family protein [Intestinibacter sp.]MDY2734465.1 ATP-grasp fold amidoligase family protein [Intestinibacter sp.]MDY6255604.1 ATP-grasp fold amidoligase family protein [Bacteroidales bacterium]